MKVKVIIGGNVISLFDSETYEPIEIESVHFGNSNEAIQESQVVDKNLILGGGSVMPNWRTAAPESNEWIKTLVDNPFINSVSGRVSDRQLTLDLDEETN